MATLRYRAGDEDPTVLLRWLDHAGASVDLSAATWSVKLVGLDGTVALTKTSGVTAYAALQGSSPNDYNVAIQWSSGDLAVTAGQYALQIVATVSGRDRTFPTPINVIIVGAS